MLSERHIASELTCKDSLILMMLPAYNVVINCIPIINDLTPEKVLSVQNEFCDKGLQFINLWEDVWHSRQIQVLNRINSIAGKNTRIHGRKTSVVSLDKHQADEFLSAFHIQGPALARYKLGLVHETELVAVATFSGTRLMRQQAEGYRSAELIRFATKPGYTVAGGLTKLIKHFAATVKTNDIMSYADRDWSMGKGYKSAGFTFHSLIPPSELWLDTRSNKRYFKHRLPKVSCRADGDSEVEADFQFVKIFNTGNLKYILYL